jgi:hypothetical protein
MLAENIKGFVKYVQKSYENKNSSILNIDKVYQIKLIMEEFQFQIIAAELLRVNQFSWDEKNTRLLVDRFRQGIDIIDEYVKRNYNDLFLFSPRIHTLKSLSKSLCKKESI